MNALQPLLTTRASLKKGVFFALGAFVLSGVRLFSQSLPLAACLVAALPMGLQPMLATLGAILGYFLRCDAAAAAEYTATTLLMLAAVAVFQGTRLTVLPWFMPTIAACVCGILGGLGIIGGSAQTAFLLAKVLLAALATAYFRKMQTDRNSVVLCAMLCAGFCGFVPFDLALAAACAVCCSSGELSTAAAVGLAIELSGNYGQCAITALLLPALLRPPKKALILHGLMYFLLPTSVFFCFGRLNFALLTAIFTGSVIGLCLRRFFPTALRSPEMQTSLALEQAAQIMDMTCKQLPQEIFTASNQEAEEVYDAAAERVCRCCPRFHRCWEHHAPQTYEALCSASHRIIERGIAYAEDFPLTFRDACCHLEGFLTAVNQELEGMLYRRRYRMQLKESRRVLAQELSCLAEYLRQAQNETKPQTALFRPQVGICAREKSGEQVCGDQGVCFSGCKGDFFVLLCDGMGTGEAAAVSGNQTLQFLQKLLKSGLAPLSALRLLNGTELLSGGSYTTVDLLHADLVGGTATLYKWGAAPSYLRHFDEIRTIGEAAPPPGVSAAQEPKKYSLCLKRQELLVLVSDGADGENVRAILKSYCGNSPRELAALLAGNAREDDITAVAITLKPAS